MELSAVFQAVFETKTDGTAFAAADLQPGDRLTGRVLKLVDKERALIDLGAFRATARMGFSVLPGDLLKLKVLHSGNPLHLQVEVKSAQRTSKELSPLNFTQLFTSAEQQQLVGLMDRLMGLTLSRGAALQVPGNIKHALIQVKAIFEDIPIQKPIAQLSQWLRHAVEDRGIWFEKKMADTVAFALQENAAGLKNTEIAAVRNVIATDLKSNLLMLKSLLQEKDMPKLVSEKMSEGEMKWVRRSLDKIFDHITQQQDRSVRSWREGDSFQIIAHTIPFKDKKQPVQLKVFYHKKGTRQSGESHQRIALLLHMDRLGPVRADLSMTGRHLKIQFFVQTDAVRQRFEQQSDGIEKALQGIFEDVVLITRVSQNKIAQFNQPEKAGLSSGRIDIKI